MLLLPLSHGGFRRDASHVIGNDVFMYVVLCPYFTKLSAISLLEQSKLCVGTIGSFMKHSTVRKIETTPSPDPRSLPK